MCSLKYCQIHLCCWFSWKIENLAREDCFACAIVCSVLFVTPHSTLASLWRSSIVWDRGTMWSSCSWNCQNSPHGCQSMVNLLFDFQAKYHILLFLYYTPTHTSIFCRVFLSHSHLLSPDWMIIRMSSHLFSSSIETNPTDGISNKLVKTLIGHNSYSSSTVDLYKKIWENLP